VVSFLLSVTFGCGVFIAVAHVVNQRFIAPAYDVAANLVAFGCAAAASALASTDARAAVAIIRPGDRVAASARLGPHVATRDVLLPLPAPFADPQRPYLLASVTGTSPAAQAGVDVALVDNDADPTALARLDALVQAGAFTATRFATVTVFRRLP